VSPLSRFIAKNMRQITTAIIAFLLSFGISNAQEITLKGYVRDSLTLEPLLGATIYDAVNEKGVTTNEHGYFTFIVKRNKVIEVSYVGYKTFLLNSDTVQKNIITILLSPALELDAVKVTATGSKGIKYEPLAAKLSISQETINALPAIGGEKDLIKGLYFLPSVSGAHEGASAMIVRGGNTDQNLFLIDGAPLYNTGHLFNLVSIFNADAVNKIDFYSSAYPARYGSRLSSVVDVSIREGNKNEFGGNFDIGLINSKLLLEGPIGKNQKASYIISARSSYLDLVNIEQKDKFDRGEVPGFTGYTFYDLSGKVNYEFNEKNKIFASFYYSLDYHRNFFSSNFRMDDDLKYTTIHNNAFSIRSYHSLSEKLFLQAGLHYTTNRFVKESKQSIAIWDQAWNKIPTYKSVDEQTNSLNELQAKINLNWYFSQSQTIRTGLSFSMLGYKPFNYQRTTDYYLPNENPEFIQYNESPQKSNELIFFAEDEIDVTRKLKFLPGMRVSSYYCAGQHYFGFEPRLSLSYSLSNTLSLSAAYGKILQNSHALVKNEGYMDHVIWVSSTKKIKPQKGNHYSLTFAGSTENGLDFSSSVYYKTMQNLLWYPHNVHTQNEFPYANWEGKASTNGNGESFGAEFMVGKSFSKLSFRGAYTWSRSFRVFPELNNGKSFPSQFDRPHSININSEYAFSKMWKMSLLWELHSGTRVNIPTAKVNENPYTNDYFIFPTLFTAQLPVYHRLDVSVSYERKVEKGVLGVRFNIYNIYNKHNPYGYELDTKEVVDSNGNIISSTNIIKSVALFPILPSLNITYKF